MDTKPWFLSKTFWGAMVVVLATVFSMVGVQVDVAGLDQDVVTLLGAAVAIWGRFVAKGPLSVM